ncbi:MAG: GNAT family N-acetyltransferase [Anaerolineales bacterium]|nr:GNAT family N-acetyltransferase [Anaerolineales bacterium]
MIKRCLDVELETVLAVINDAAQAYYGVIPQDAWHEPYMARDELKSDIRAGVQFWGYYVKECLVGVMGVQDIQDVTLIRHAYVRTSERRSGVGTKLIKYLDECCNKPILIGTWADATWAIEFYKKNGYRLILGDERGMLLEKYWTVPTKQASASVVLANAKWTGSD